MPLNKRQRHFFLKVEILFFLHKKSTVMKTRHTILLLALALCVNTNSVKAQVNVQDSLALVDLYKSTNGTDWYHRKNWLTINPVSTWWGIIVTNGRVTY